MEDKFTLTIEWKNADIYFPELENDPIVYCTANKKIGTIKSVKNQWGWLKEKYNIKVELSTEFVLYSVLSFVQKKSVV